MQKKYICPQCHHIGKPALKKRGSIRTDVMGWLIFPLGVPYTIWRMFGKLPVCKGCGHDILIDTESMVGRRLLAKEEKVTRL